MNVDAKDVDVQIVPPPVNAVSGVGFTRKAMLWLQAAKIT
jgi:hypothetical protein